MASDILRLQEYLFNGLLSCDLFAAFNVVLERQFLAQSEIEFSAIWQTPRVGRTESGIGLYVEMPKLEVPKPNSLQRNLVASIVTIEERNINMAAGVGSQVSAEELSELALDFMFGWVLGFSSGLTPEAGAIRPAPDVIQGDGLVTLRSSVNLRREHRATGRCDVPVIGDLGNGSYSLTNGTNTPAADIYFTTDLSFPGKSNAAAVRYLGPVVLVPGSTVTYAAWQADRLPSHVWTKVIS